MKNYFLYCLLCNNFFLILKMPMRIGRLIILIMFTILWSAKKRYSLAYQRLKHRINCKMIKLIKFDEVKFYSVVLASMEWVNSLIYKPGIFLAFQIHVCSVLFICWLKLLQLSHMTFTEFLHAINIKKHLKHTTFIFLKKQNNFTSIGSCKLYQTSKTMI